MHWLVRRRRAQEVTKSSRRLISIIPYGRPSISDVHTKTRSKIGLMCTHAPHSKYTEWRWFCYATPACVLAGGSRERGCCFSNKNNQSFWRETDGQTGRDKREERWSREMPFTLHGNISRISVKKLFPEQAFIDFFKSLLQSMSNTLITQSKSNSGLLGLERKEQKIVGWEGKDHCHWSVSWFYET